MRAVSEYVISLQLADSSYCLEADTINEMIRDGNKVGITEITHDEKKLIKVLLIILQFPFSGIDLEVSAFQIYYSHRRFVLEC